MLESLINVLRTSAFAAPTNAAAAAATSVADGAVATASSEVAVADANNGVSTLIAKGAMALRVIVMFFTVLGGSLNILLFVWLRLTHPVRRRS